MNIAVAILGLAFLILVHEAGHFYTALATGMRPRRFFIGFPPAVVSKTRNGVQYGIGAIPLGGYVKIPGMHRPSTSDVDLYFGPALREEASLVPSVEALRRHLDAGDHEAATAALGRLQVEIDASDLTPSAARAAGRGFSEIGDGCGGDAYWRAATWKRVLVIFAGPGTNLLFAIILFAALFMSGNSINAVVSTKVAAVTGHPATAAGLRVNDDIVAVNGAIVERPEQISQIISGSKGKPVTLAVMRGPHTLVLRSARPKMDGGAYRLGFQLSVDNPSYGPLAALGESVKLTGTIAKGTVLAFANLVHGSGRKDIAGPVGIVQTSSDALQQSTVSYLYVLGLISLSLAFLNLLPFLPLDGGHIVFSLIEGIRGRAIRREVYERASAVGIALVLLLAFIGLSSDIGRISG